MDVMGMRLLCLLGLVGCFNPHPVGGTCETTAQCPSPLECVAGMCGGSAQELPDADPSCRCAPDGLICASGTVSCALGCVASAPARCARLIPSNGIQVELYDRVSVPIAISTDAIIDTDLGTITGGFTRAAGEGVQAGIDYEDVGAIGVFVMSSLELHAKLRVVGTRAAAILIAGDATIDGTIDGTASFDGHPQTPGPGGGAGGRANLGAAGCAPGAAGTGDLATKADSGGGGGGGGIDLEGANGGAADGVPGGIAGAGCVTADAQPLVGGSGGGGGGLGLTAGAYGGGGGGAIQLSVSGTLAFTALGFITVGGGGGQGGDADASNGANAGAGGGGGGGGVILVEAVALETAPATFFAANGGGGGGGAFTVTKGIAGDSGKLGAAAAPGGASGGGTATAGGIGGCTSAPTTGVDTTTGTNAGGGGGGGGVIRLNTLAGSAQAVNASPAYQTWGSIQHQ